MKKRINLNFILSALFLLLFILFTASVKIYDVKPVGPENSMIGYSSLNMAVFNKYGENPFLYTVTEIFGYIALLTAAGFGLVGLLQLIRRRSIKKVDSSILLLGAFYVIVMGFYGLFEVFIINYRPVLVDGVLEASYPSSHTMLVICIMATAIMQYNQRIKSPVTKVLADSICVIIIGVTIVGRLLSGVHWFTDIIGSVILSTSLIIFYYSFVKLFNYRKQLSE